MMKHRKHFESKHTTKRLAGLLCVGLVALSSVSCGLVKPTITPDAYAKSVGKKQMKADEDACLKYGGDERHRLLVELLNGDQTTGNDLGREMAAGSTAHEMVKIKGGSSAKADAVGEVVEMLFSSNDPNTEDERRLAKYLGIEGGLGAGFTATLHLRNTCLRRKGYKVEQFEEDGKGMHYLEREPRARIVLREDDGTQKVLYEYIPYSQRNK